jgi:hypothetical protein
MLTELEHKFENVSLLVSAVGPPVDEHLLNKLTERDATGFLQHESTRNGSSQEAICRDRTIHQNHHLGCVDDLLGVGFKMQGRYCCPFENVEKGR